MGIEISPPARLRPGHPKDKHSSTRVYSKDGEVLFTQNVHKREYREPPKGFEVVWTSRKSNVDIAKAAVAFHLLARRRFGIPEDALTEQFVRAVQEQALAIAWRAEMRNSDDTLIRLIEKNRERIEPLVVVRKVGSEGRVRSTYGLPRIGLSRPDYVERICNDFTSRLPSGAGLVEARVVSPFGVTVIEGGEPGVEKRVVFASRFRLVRPVTALFMRTTGVELAQDEVNAINDRFKKPIIELPGPREAVNRG
jgi:hypothetical protein